MKKWIKRISVFALTILIVMSDADIMTFAETVSDNAISCDEKLMEKEAITNEINTEADEDVFVRKSDAIIVASRIDTNLEWSLDSNGLLLVSVDGDLGSDCLSRSIMKDNVDKAEVNYIKVTGKGSGSCSLLFGNFKKVVQIDISNFDTSDVTDMSSMFRGCTLLKKINLGDFDTSNVTDMSFMFQYCKNLQEIDLHKCDTSKVIRMERMFDYCESLQKLDLSNFNTSSVTYMQFMFSECRSLQEIDLSKFDTFKVTDMSGMFLQCNVLQKLDLSNFNTSNVTNMQMMFDNCESLQKLGISNFNTSKVTDMNTMFRSCHNLQEIDLSNFDTTNVTDMSWMFALCDSLPRLDVSNFNTSKVTDMNGMFSACDNLQELNLCNFDTSQVTDMDYMFAFCCEIKGLDFSSFDTSKVTDMGLMFEYCDSLQKLDLSSFDTSNVKYMDGMFMGCGNLQEIDLRSFNTSNTTDISDMFGYCRNIQQLDLSNFDMTNVSDASNIFSSCYNMRRLFLPANINLDIQLPYSMYDENNNKYSYAIKNLSAPALYRKSITDAITGTYLLENDLMDKVSLYTSTDGSVYAKAFNNLITRLENGNYTQEEKYRIMNQFWTGLGYTDIEEGISYCHDSTEAGRAYDYLVTNDSYGAYQYWEWLNCTKDGNVARGLLLADDLIFNNGILQYADVNTYLTAETHSIKAYKSMLLDFMDHDVKNMEFLDYVDNLNKLASGITDASNTSLLNNYFKKMNNAKTMEEAKEIYGKYVDEIKVEIKKNNKSGNIIVQNLSGYKEIKEITNNAGLIIDTFSCEIEDLTYFALLETRLETISYYESFLDSIIAGQDVLPFDLVVAAAQLKNELLQNSTVAYLHKLSARLLDFVASDHVLDLKGYLKNKLEVGSETTVGGAIETIKLAALIVDIATGIGDTVDASRCVEAYAYLGMYYSNLLRQCKNDFIENKTIENAWKFYDTYQLLFRIRYMGENAYLEMSKAQGIIGTIIKSCNWNFFGIQDKEVFVRETIEYLNNHCVFAIKGFSDKGNEHYYSQKAIIKCPVDIEIYDESGTLLYKLYDKREVDETTGDGRFLCKYDSALGEFVKVIYLNDDKQYRFLIKGVDVGNVTLETARNDGEKVKIAQISGLPIEVGGIITFNTETNKYDVDKDGDGKKEIIGNLSETKKDERILISKIYLSEESLRMNIGGKIALGTIITPSNATFSELEWSSSDPKVVEVYHGGVYAKGQGTATVSAKSQDGSNLVVHCNVVVENDKKTDEKEDDNTNTLPDNGSSDTPDDNTLPDNGSSDTPDDNTLPDNGSSDTPDDNTLPDKLDTWKTMIGTEGFVCRLYNIALGREAEEKGFREWTQKLNSQKNTAAEVAQGFIFSEEFMNKKYNDAQFVKMLYRTMFGREADEGGLRGWLSDMENGMSREYVFRGFAESQEFTNLCDSYHVKRGSVTLSAYRDKNKGATGFIARLYTKMLGRKYEDKGLEYWCKEYLTGKQSIEQIATNGFLHSEELSNQKLSDEEFVTRMYETFLNREPEETGLKDWIGRLQSGKTTRDKLVYGFTNSQEFGNIKATYGLK